MSSRIALSCDRDRVVSFLRRLLCIVRNLPEQTGPEPIESSSTQSSAVNNCCRAGTSMGAEK